MIAYFLVVGHVGGVLNMERNRRESSNGLISSVSFTGSSIYI